jgi:hypothetical protein
MNSYNGKKDMMYNLAFLHDIFSFENTDVIMVFHNEKDACNIIKQIKDEVISETASAFTERDEKEIFLSLKYPAPNESLNTFNSFFDSPKCVSMLYSKFKGAFVVDCTDYDTNSVKSPAFEKLVSYVNEEANSEFKFVLILNQAVKSNVENKFKNSFSCDLILSAAFLKDFLKFDEEIKKYLGDRFIKGDQELRKLSPAQLRTCVEKIKTDPDNYKEIIEAAIASTTTERKIGF